MDQVAYWDTVGAGKTFTHPVEPSWLSGVDRDARILDYGCGYGRVMALLSSHGFTDVSGVDPSPALLARGRAEHPGLRFDPQPSETYDVILLVAVLTCIPADEDQLALIATLSRLLNPGGLLYLSDVPLQDDPRNRARYTRTPYGVFDTGDGALCRHHDPAWLHTLLTGFTVTRERHVTVTTMNGHPSTALQLLARKPR